MAIRECGKIKSDAPKEAQLQCTADEAQKTRKECAAGELQRLHAAGKGSGRGKRSKPAVSDPPQKSEQDSPASAPSRAGRSSKRAAADRASERLEARLRDILRQATPSAVRLLAQAIDNEELTISVRLDCAKDVLNRVYGKQAPPEEAKGVTFVLEEALKDYVG